MKPRADSLCKMVSLLLVACASEATDPVEFAPPQTAAVASTSGSPASVNVEPSYEGAPVLFGAPLIFNPTSDGFGINVVVASGEAARLGAFVREAGQDDYLMLDPPAHPAENIAQWDVVGLSPGMHFEYQITDLPTDGGEARLLFEGDVVTQRPPGEGFSFTVITDSHVPQPVPTAQQRDEIEAVYSAVMSDVAELEDPDFIVNLGDMLDFHMYGFNAPPLRAEGSRDAYMNYRSLMGPLLGNAAHFPVIGNWEGENGCFAEDVIDRSLGQRLLYMPGPEPSTYPEGGSTNEDYYAFQWGDALFVVLNVMTYTETCHELSSLGGQPEDWTLGDDQLAWFEKTLSEATSKWRFVLIHHVVGGAAGNPANSNYGRGGGQGAYIGEQALVHEMMLQSGVNIFFYGHDHVFTDMVVDGIHYTLPGSAGAPWKFVTSETGYVNYWPDSGYGRVRVSPEEVQVDFIAQGGAQLYTYTLPEDQNRSLNEPPLPPSADAQGPSDAAPAVEDGGVGAVSTAASPATALDAGAPGTAVDASSPTP